jgi:membrane protease subunit HflC
MVRLLVGIALVIVFVFAIVRPAFTIGEWEQGIILQFGEWQRTLREPGLYFKIPGIHTLITFKKWVLTTDANAAEYITLDKKRVMVDHVSRWRIEKPLEFYRTVRNQTQARTRLDAVISARLRQEIAKHNFLDLIRENREEIMQVVTRDTIETSKSFGIEVLDVRIKRLDLPEEVQDSVFARMRAERERIAKRYRAEGDEVARGIRAGAQREREVILATAYETSEKLKGQGDAKATETYAKSFGQDAEFYAFTRRLQTYEKILTEGTTLVLPADSELLSYLQSPGSDYDQENEIPAVEESSPAEPAAEDQTAAAPPVTPPAAAAPAEPQAAEPAQDSAVDAAVQPAAEPAADLGQLAQPSPAEG